MADKNLEAIYQQMAKGQSPTPSTGRAAMDGAGDRLEAVYQELAKRGTSGGFDVVPDEAMGDPISTVTGRPIRSPFPKRTGTGMVQIGDERIPEGRVKMSVPVADKPNLPWMQNYPGMFDTGEPERTQRTTADLSTEAAVSWTDDPRTKLQMYAKRRFPDIPVQEAVKRYGITDDGELVFKADDGQVYRESAGVIPRAVADNLMGGSLPANVAATAAGITTGGFAAPMVGAMAGRTVQQGVDAAIRDPRDTDLEPVTIRGYNVPGLTKAGLRNLAMVGLEGLFEVVGEGIGRMFGGAAETAGKVTRNAGIKDPTARAVNRLPEADMSRFYSPEGADFARTQELQGTAREMMGGELNAPVAAGDKSLEFMFNTGGGMQGGPARQVRAERGRMNEMARQGIESFRRETAPNSPGPVETGNRLARTASDIESGIRSLPGQEARPLYEEAYAGMPQEGVDLQPIVDELRSVQADFYGNREANKFARSLEKDLVDEPDTIDIGRGNVLPDFRRGGGEDLTPTGGGTPVPPEPTTSPTAAGRRDVVYTPDNQPIDVVYHVQDIRDVTPSHNDAMRPNPGYPAELQPRDRSSDALALQVESMASDLNPARLGESADVTTGAPIIGPDGVVESGNGRVMAIRRAYGRNQGDAYRSWLQRNADRLGINPADLENIEYPVLTRMRTTDVDRAAFARTANASQTARMSPADQARADAEKITLGDLDLFAPDKSGDLTAASNRPFVQRFLSNQGMNETAGLVTGEGAQMTPDLVNRIRAAVFHKAYQNPQLLGIMAEETRPGIRRILDGLTTAAPDFAKARAAAPEGSLGELDVPGRVADAVGLIRRARAESSSVDQILAQQSMFDDDVVDPATARIANFLEKNKRSGAKVGAYLQEAGRRVKNHFQNRTQMDLFGDGPQPTMDDVLTFAERKAYDTPDTDVGGGSTLGGMALGSGAGIEQDDEGNWTFDPKKALAGIGAGALTATAISKIYAGRKAAGMNETALEKALKMDVKGAPERAIREETGWFKGPDGKWRFEVSDADIKFTDKLTPDETGAASRAGALEDVIEHDKLFNQYPDLRGIDADVVINPNLKQEYGNYHPGSPGDDYLFGTSPVITVYAKTPEKARETLMHEIQHAIQEKENFMRGGSPAGAPTAKELAEKINERFRQRKEEVRQSEEYKQLARQEAQRLFDQKAFGDVSPRTGRPYTLESYMPAGRESADWKMGVTDLEIQREGKVKELFNDENFMNKGYAGYRRLGGEVESRDVAARAFLTPEERAALAPYETQGIAPEDMIIRTEGGGPAMSAQEFTDRLEAMRKRYSDIGIDFAVFGSPERGLTLHKIEIPKGERGTGKATKAINELIELADQSGSTIKLSPTNEYGASKKRLTDFYKKLGFVENKGRNKDLQISETMYRLPKSGGGGNVMMSTGGPTPDGPREHNLKRLHDLRQSLDKSIDQGAPFNYGRVRIDDPGADANTLDALKRIRGAVDRQLATVPGFKEADAVFSESWKRNVEPWQNSLITKVQRTGDTESIDNLHKLFRAENVQPESIVRTRRAIESKDPELWKNIVAEWIGVQSKKVLSELRQQGDRNIPKGLVDRLWKADINAERLKAALPKSQYRKLENIMEIMDRMGRLYADNSATAGRQQYFADIQAEALKYPLGRAVQAASALSKIPAAFSGDTWRQAGPNMKQWALERIFFGKHMDKIMKGLISPTKQIEQQLAKVRGVQPSNPEFWNGLGRLVGMAAYHSARQKNQLEE